MKRPSSFSLPPASYLAMGSSALFFAVMSALIKQATRSSPLLPASELAVIRYLFGIGFLLLVARIKGTNLLGNDRRGLLLRGVYGGIAATSFFVGIQFTTLTHAILLNYSFVIWAPLIASFTLGEKLGRRGIFAVVTALNGVVLVTRPEGNTVQIGDLIALFSGVMAGLAVVQIRRLRQGESSYSIFFYFNLFGIPIALASAPLTKAPFVWPSLMQWPLLIGVGITSVSGQLLMTYGYREMRAAQGTLLSLTSVLYAALLSAVFFAEPITGTTVIGGLLILISATIMTLPSSTEK